MSAEIKADDTIMIRSIVAGDIDTLLELERRIFPDPWTYDAFLDQVKGNGWGGFVAESSCGIIGYACYYVAASESHLTNIAVVEEFRRKSVAKLLLDHILEVVTKFKCEYLLLEVRPSNQSAISFYEKHQFQFLYRRPRYYHSPVEDALVYVRYLDEDKDD